jgi:Holliday junction resolvase RusA-like endonuclease
MVDAEPIADPVYVTATFQFERPQSHLTARGALRGNAPTQPTGRNVGDVDKLLRAVLDGLVQGGAIKDDSLVVSAFACKMWAPTPGVHITIEVRP